MRGYVDQVTPNKVSGWVFDPEAGSEKMQVRLTLGDRVVVEGLADLPRPDVGKKLGTSGAHGFRFAALTLSPKDVERVAIVAKAVSGADWKPVRRGGSRRRGQYQTFGDAKGGSRSAEKLKALRLSLLRNRHDETRPLKGLSVLDIGCNEGFFCGEALRQGARRVVGIDMKSELPRPRPPALSRRRVPPRLLVGAAGREVRRDPLSLGDPLRATAAGAARQARPAPDADRHAGARVRR